MWTNESFSLWHCLLRDSTLFSTDRSAGLVLNQQGSKVSEDTWGITYIPYSTIKEKYVLKREFLYFKGFMERFLHFDIGVKEKPPNVHLILIFCHVLNQFNLSNCFLGLTYGFLNKNFQEINWFICHCSFITLAQETTMTLQIVRFLETFRQALSWIKTEVLFLHVPL